VTCSRFLRGGIILGSPLSSPDPHWKFPPEEGAFQQMSFGGINIKNWKKKRKCKRKKEKQRKIEIKLVE
jgi:hypothetical protein